MQPVNETNAGPTDRLSSVTELQSPIRRAAAPRLPDAHAAAGSLQSAEDQVNAPAPAARSLLGAHHGPSPASPSEVAEEASCPQTFLLGQILAGLPQRTSAGAALRVTLRAQMTNPAQIASFMQRRGAEVFRVLLDSDSVTRSAFEACCQLAGNSLVQRCVERQGWIPRRAAQHEDLMDTLLDALPASCWFTCLHGEAWRQLLRARHHRPLLKLFEAMDTADLRTLIESEPRMLLSFSMQRDATWQHLDSIYESRTGHQLAR
jgi:hypothetical protein